MFIASTVASVSKNKGKKGATCKFSHDAVLAAFRKSNSVTIDSWLLTHCESCSHCVGGNISNFSSSKSDTIDSGLLVQC
jgi:hypothetical protein